MTPHRLEMFPPQCLLVVLPTQKTTIIIPLVAKPEQNELLYSSNSLTSHFLSGHLLVFLQVFHEITAFSFPVGAFVFLRFTLCFCKIPESQAERKYCEMITSAEHFTVKSSSM